MGALGFEPRSAGFFHAESYSARSANYGSLLQLVIIRLLESSSNPLAITPITGAREDAVLPHAPGLALALLLPHLPHALPAAQLLLSPLPALLAALLPDPRASLHFDSSA